MKRLILALTFAALALALPGCGFPGCDSRERWPDRHHERDHEHGRDHRR